MAALGPNAVRLCGELADGGLVDRVPPDLDGPAVRAHDAAARARRRRGRRAGGQPSRGTAEVPEQARVLLDEFTLWGDQEAARAGLDRWYAAGADMPSIVLPPGRPVEELDRTLEALRPS
jgi:hypothetical protein